MKPNLLSSYASLDDYVNDTVAKFRRKDPAVTKLQIDDFHYPDIDLEGEEYFDSPTICLLLKEAEQSPYLKSVELRFVEITQAVATALLNLLVSRGTAQQQSTAQRQWDSVAIIGCTGLGAQNSRPFRTLAAGIANSHRLLLNHNNIKTHGLNSLGNLLRHNPLGFKSLHFKRENLKSEGAEAFFDGLRHNRNLEELVLNFCRFDDQGVEAFANALRHNRTIRNLDLGACYLPDRHIRHLLDALVGHPKLENLVLTLNACHRQGTEALGALLSNNRTKLVSLNLSHQKTESTDQQQQQQQQQQQTDHRIHIEHIAQALQTNTSLRILKLSRNKLRLDDLRPLIHVLQIPANETANTDAACNTDIARCYNDTLEVLDLNNNAFRDEMFSAVARALPRMTGLQKLYMLNNDIQQQDAIERELAEGMSDNVTLEVLGIKERGTTVRQLTALNRAGRRLLTEDDYVPLALWPSVLQRIGRISWSVEYPAIKSGDNEDCSYAYDAVYHMLHGPALLHSR